MNIWSRSFNDVEISQKKGRKNNSPVNKSPTWLAEWLNVSRCVLVRLPKPEEPTCCCRFSVVVVLPMALSLLSFVVN